MDVALAVSFNVLLPNSLQVSILVVMDVALAVGTLSMVRQFNDVSQSLL